jgi:hypothetical protein
VEDLNVDARIILKCIIEKQDVKVRTGINWLRIWSNGGLSEQVNEPFCFLKTQVISCLDE